jgi:hypothetical protein
MRPAVKQFNAATNPLHHQERTLGMPHQDTHQSPTNLQALKAIFGDLIPLHVDQLPRHGNATISPQSLIAVAIACWGWTTEGTLSDRVATAVKAVGRFFPLKKTITRQGLMNALRSCGTELVDQVVDHFAARTRTELRGHWSSGGRANIAVDGTKFMAPRTQANQASFAPDAARKKKGHKPKEYNSEADKAKAKTVQLLVTVFYHIGSGLPIRWRVNSSSGSERKNVVEQLDELPANARLIGDAEYVGYPLWKSIIQSRRTFLFRVGSNVKLLKNLGEYHFKDGYVYYWPDASRRREEQPLVFRLIQIHNGKEAVYLVTNELDMTDEQASMLYRQRWDIEVFFRSVKQSCQRSKLCCQTPDNVLTEIHWTLLGIWAALFVGKQTFHDQKEPLSRLSPVKLIRACHLALLAVALRAQDAPLLMDELRRAFKADESGRKRSKQSRNYPRKRKHRPPKPPVLIDATAEQRREARKH